MEMTTFYEMLLVANHARMEKLYGERYVKERGVALRANGSVDEITATNYRTQRVDITLNGTDEGYRIRVEPWEPSDEEHMLTRPFELRECPATEELYRRAHKATEVHYVQPMCDDGPECNGCYFALKHRGMYEESIELVDAVIAHDDLHVILNVTQQS